MKRMPGIPVLFFLLLACCTKTRGMDSAAWARKAAQRCLGLRSLLLPRYDKKFGTFNQQVAASLKTTPSLPIPFLPGIYTIAPDRVEYRKNRYPFIPYNHKQRPQGLVACQWTVALKKDIPVIVRLGFGATAVFLDGRPLVRSRGSFWTLPLHTGLAIASHGAPFRIVAFPRQNLRQTPGITILPGNSEKFFRRMLESCLQPATPDLGRLAEILRSMRTPDDDISYQLVAPLVRFYFDQAVLAFKAKNLPRQQRDFASVIRSLAAALPNPDRASLVHTLRADYPPWLLQAYARCGWPTNAISALLSEHADDDLRALLKAYTKVVITAKSNAQVKAYYLNLIYGLVANELLPQGNFAVAEEQLKQIKERFAQDPAVKKGSCARYYYWLTDLLHRLPQISQNAVQFASDPEAPQHDLEFRNLLQRGADNRRAVNIAFGMIRKFGGEMLQKGWSLVRLQQGMAQALRQTPDFLATMRQAASKRLQPSVQDMFTRADLPGLERLVLQFGFLLDTAPIHLRLADEYFDRGQLQNALRHALCLLASGNRGPRAAAMARVIMLEHFTHASSAQVTPLPPDLAQATVQLGGRRVRLRDLQGRYPRSPTARKTTGSPPGKLLATIPLPDSVRGVMVTAAGRRDLTGFASQPVEPAFSQGRLYLAGPGFVKVIDSKNWRTAWSFGGERQWLQVPASGSAMAFTASPVNNMLCTLQALPGGIGFQIRAFDAVGNTVWNTGDFSAANAWEPLCAPYPAFGTSFTLALNKTLTSQKQVALAQVDLATGRLFGMLPINQFPDDYPLRRLRFGSHFTHDSSAIYGWTGSGAVFAVNPETLNLKWVVALPLRSRLRGISPAGWVRKVGKTLVAQLSDIHEWLGLDPEQGTIRWHYSSRDYLYVHSRHSSRYLLATVMTPGRGQTLVRIDPDNGQHLWRVSTGGLKVSGEGCVMGEEAYLPVRAGIAVFACKDGRLLRVLPCHGDQPLKLRRLGGYWLLMSESAAHVLAAGGKFAGSALKPAPRSTGPGFLEPDPKQLTLEHNGPIPYKQWSLEREITLPVRISDRHRELLPTRKRFHYLLKSDNRLLLLREGYRDRRGRFLAPDVLWARSFRAVRVSGDQVLQYSARRVRIFDALEPWRTLFAFTPPPGRDVAKAIVRGDILAVLFRGGGILTYDWRKRKLLGGRNGGGDIKLDGGFLYSLAGRNVTCCAARNPGKVLWRQTKCGSMLTSGNRCIIWERNWGKNPVRLVNALTGKVVARLPASDPHRMGRVSAGRYWHGGTGVELATGKRQKYPGRFYFGRDPDGALAVTATSFTWVTRKQEYRLPAPADAWWRRVLGQWNVECVPQQRGNRLLIYVPRMGRTLIYDLARQKLVCNIAIAPGRGQNELVAILRRSQILTFDGRRLYFLGLRPKGTATRQVVSFPDGVQGTGWPTRGWARPTRLGRNAWLPAGAADPASEFDLWVGANRKHLYLRLHRGAGSRSGISHYLRLGLDWDYAYPGIFTWSLSTGTSCLAPRAIQPHVRSWREDNPDGSSDFYLRIARAAFPSDASKRTFSPRFRVEITERDHGELRGLFQHAGAASVTTNLPLGQTQNLQMLSPTDFALYRELYSHSHAFFPQGRELARWLQSRRALRGVEDNIRFLQGMVRRLKGAFCVVNPLAALFLERLEAIRRQHPDWLETSPEFRKAAQDALKRIKAFADQVGVRREWSARALTFIALTVYPLDLLTGYCLSGLRARTSKRSPWGNGWLSTRWGTYATGRQDRQFVVYWSPGINGEGYTDISGIDIGFKESRSWRVAFGGLRLLTPQGVRELVSDAAKPQPGVSFSKDIYPVNVNFGGVRLPAIACRNPYASGPICFKPLPLAPAPKALKLKPADTLLALRSLPSNTRIGMMLIDLYLRAVAKDPKLKQGAVTREELYRVLLQRTNFREEILSQVTGAFANYLRAQKLETPVILARMSAFMKASGVRRASQRRIFLRFNNALVGYGAWANLGPLPWSKRFKLQPRPEAVEDVAEATFALMEPTPTKRERGAGKQPEKERPREQEGEDAEGAKPKPRIWRQRGAAVTFRIAGSKTRRTRTGFHLPDTRNRGQNLAYHAAVLQLERKTKVYFYLGMLSYSNRRRTEVALWIDGKRKLKKQAMTGELLTIPCRLPAGEHLVLLRVLYTSNWDLLLAMGNRYGAPIPGLKLKKPPFAKFAKAAAVANKGIPIRYIGPFDNTGGKGFTQEYKPEKFINFKSPYKAIGGFTGWEQAKTGPRGKFSFINRFKVAGKPRNDNAVAYAVTYVRSPARRQAIISIGSDDGAKVWVNRKQVIANNTARGAAPGQDEAKVLLHKGWNQILLKVTQGNGDWGFYLELFDENHQPLPGLEFSDQKQGKRRKR